jgi:hypothetical protein
MNPSMNRSRLDHSAISIIIRWVSQPKKEEKRGGWGGNSTRMRNIGDDTQAIGTNLPVQEGPVLLSIIE